MSLNKYFETIEDGAKLVSFDALKQEYPEGIPKWIIERGSSIEEIRELVEMRRKAFSKTINPDKYVESFNNKEI